MTEPEKLGEEVARALLGELDCGGVVDRQHQWLAALFMSMAGDYKVRVMGNLICGGSRGQGKYLYMFWDAVGGVITVNSKLSRRIFKNLYSASFRANAEHIFWYHFCDFNGIRDLIEIGFH